VTPVFRQFWSRPAILRHDPGLAASPPVGYTLKVERGGALSLSIWSSAVDGSPAREPAGARRTPSRISPSGTTGCGAAAGTWFHTFQSEKSHTAEGNRALKEQRVREGRAHAVLVFDGEVAVGAGAATPFRIGPQLLNP
jgi:hypothetical protein